MPCIGSHAHTTGWPESLTARSNGGSALGHSVGAHAAEEHESTRDAAGVETRAQRDGFLGRGRRSELHADRVVHAGEELDVSAIELSRAFTGPQQVGRAVVPVAGDAVATSERFLVPEQQRFVRGPHVDLVELELGLEIDPARS